MITVLLSNDIVSNCNSSLLLRTSRPGRSSLLTNGWSKQSESVAASVAEWSCEGRVGGVDGTWVSLESLLEAVVHTYNDMR